MHFANLEVPPSEGVVNGKGMSNVWEEGRMRRMMGGLLGGELAYEGTWGGGEGRGRNASTAAGGRGVRRSGEGHPLRRGEQRSTWSKREQQYRRTHQKRL